MSVKFQYNKTSLHDLNKQLKIRLGVLPILKSKETALRVVVNQYRSRIAEQKQVLDKLESQSSEYIALIGRFPAEQLKVETLSLTEKKVAGVIIPELKEFKLRMDPILWHEAPHWYPDVLSLLEKWYRIRIKLELLREQFNRLEAERKKTTQKVNLFEKVQIPDYQEAIKKIRKYLEDKENLSKAAQKIVKTRKMV